MGILLFCHTDAKEGGAKSASFKESAENVDFIILVNECMEDPHSDTAGIFFE